MKKMTKFIPVIVLLIVSVLVLLYVDFKESSKYLKFNNFDVETISIHHDDNRQNTIKIIKEIQPIAKKNNVILAKANIDFKKENGTNVYLSLDNIDDLKRLLKENFKIEFLDNKSSSKSFISTYIQNSDNQIGVIKDLLNDHYYSYYLIDEMIAKNDSLIGNYFVFYNDFSDYSNFINEVNELLGYDSYSMAFLNNIEKYIAILIVGSLLFLLLFYFIFQVYEYYNNSKKFGCMKLLGFDINKINKNMIYDKLKIYFISVLVIIILMSVFVKNIMLSHIVLILFVNLLIILLTYIISNWSCRIINKAYKTTNILKKQNTALTISKVSYRFRIIMTIMLICFSVFAFQNINSLNDKMKIYNMSKNLLDYSIFESFVADQPELYDYDKQYNLYLNIVNNMETFYAQFTDYSQLTDSDWISTKKAEKEGKYFMYDSVDNNYLKKENIKIFNLNDKEVDIDSIKGIYFLFPKSKKELIEPFKKFNVGLKDYYQQFDSEYTFKTYLYNDKKLDTYRIELGSKYIESPILRVIDNSINIPYFSDGLGVSVFGNAMGTGLKIKLIDGDKEKTINVLNKYIDNAGLSNLLTAASFTTYQDYFNDEIRTSGLIVSFIVLAIILILIVYTLISFQILKLYIKNQRQKILVKKLLGFENNNIFDEIFKKSLNNSIIAIILSLIIVIIIKKFSFIFAVLVLIVLIFDFLIILLSIKSTKLSKIYLDLKGGSYD